MRIIVDVVCLYEEEDGTSECDERTKDFEREKEVAGTETVRESLLR